MKGGATAEGVRGAFRRSAAAVAEIPLDRREAKVHKFAALADNENATEDERTMARVTYICTLAELEGRDPVRALEMATAAFFVLAEHGVSRPQG